MALVDVRMPRMDGIAATAQLRALPLAPKVITRTTFELDENIYNALSAGADGFLLKDTNPPKYSEPSTWWQAAQPCSTLPPPVA